MLCQTLSANFIDLLRSSVFGLMLLTMVDIHPALPSGSVCHPRYSDVALRHSRLFGNNSSRARHAVVGCQHPLCLGYFSASHAGRPFSRMFVSWRSYVRTYLSACVPPLPFFCLSLGSCTRGGLCHRIARAIMGGRKIS